jgi:HSP20 family molecular chaperone IbpA
VNAQSASYSTPRATRAVPTSVHEGVTGAVVSFDVAGVRFADVLLFSRGQDLTLEATLWPNTAGALELLSVVRLPEEYDVSSSSAVFQAGRLTVTSPRTSQKVRIIDIELIA